MIYMIGFGTTSIEFKNGKIFSLLQVFNRLTLDVVSAIIKQSAVTDGIKNF